MRLLVLPCLLLLAVTAHAQNGLTGQYYDTATFGTLKTTRTDATVNFNFGSGIPAGTTITNGETFSIAWSGQIEPEFSQLYTFYVTADDGARLWVNDQLVVMRTFAAVSPEMRGQVALKAGQRVNVRLEYIEQTGGASVKLEWSCASRARQVIPTERLFPARVDKAGGSLLKEHWRGIAGGAISSLTGNANYPNKPGGREFLTSFECLAQDWAESYGTRVTGFIVPPVTGNYTFAVSGDDVVQLFLSTDATAANKTLIANVASATAFRAWGTPSGARSLVQGRRYYVELLHKENTGTDHWSVGWMKPGDAAFSVVPGSALVQPGIGLAQPAQASLLDTMAQEHPRIFATAERFAKLRATWQSATSSQPKTWAQNAINSANGILTAAPVAYAPDVRGTILSESRTVVDRMYKLGLAWQLTGDAQYAERAWTELSTVAAFTDWHPAHFLDTAEMTHGCAIGYDWFYQYWTQPRRDTIRTAIINKGLNAGLTQYTNNVGWSRSTGNNWNQVCNGGLSIGALAVGTESEALVENIMNRALNSTRPTWGHFTCDNGAWYEGPGYWGYTTEYGIRMLAAYEWVLGSDFGISATQNLSEAGFAPIQALGTANVIFNYADASAGGATRGAVFPWMARRYGQPIYDWWDGQGSGSALGALWWKESSASPAASSAPPDMAFHGEVGTAFQPQEMVTLRGRWNDSRATFVGAKGGQMGADHGNLDAGTFVLDALGKRWFHDLGGDNYALLNYFNDTPSASGTDRWDYYRMRPEGQNTLTINPSANADMVLNAVAPLLAYQTEANGTGAFSIHDLTPVYSGMSRVWRGTRLTGARDEVLVQDEIQAATGKTVWWFAHYTSPATTVVIDPDGTSATMTQGAERLWCKIVSGGGTFQIMDAVPLPTSPNPATTPPQNANTGYKKLAINLPNVTNTTLAVWFVPLSTGAAIPTTLPAITALNTWNLANTSDAPLALNGVATSSGENAVEIDLRNYVADDSTPAEQMRFSVSAPINGTVVLLADGHTARFMPTPGYTGVPGFTFTATDSTADPNAILTYDFELPDASAANLVPDASGLGRDGTLDAIGTGTATWQSDVPAALGRDGRSLDLTENGGANAARLSRLIGTTELNWNTSDWTITGWFQRRDAGNEDMIWHLSNGDGFGAAEELYLMARGASTLTLHHYPGPDVDINTTAAPPGVWHHFAVVRSGGALSLYLNGALVGSPAVAPLAINQTAPLIFGGHTDASATYAPRWFDGKLDELAVFSAALAPAEITTLAGGMTARHFGGLSATGSISLAAAPVNYVWTNPSTAGTLPWSTGANWQDGVAPASSRGSSVRFFTGQTLAGGAITSNNDLAGVLQMNNLTLAGSNSAPTTATISGGNFSLLNNGTLPPTVNLAGTSASNSTTAPNKLIYNINTPIALGADTTFNATNSGTFIFQGEISGAGGLARAGTPSTLILAGPNSYTGDTIIHAGILQIGNDGAAGNLGTGDVINNGTLRFDRTGTLEVPNSITGTGGVQIDCPIGAGTVVLTGTNTFDGNVNVSSGAVRITNSTALGDGAKTITLSQGTAGSPQLRLDGSSDPIELPASFAFVTSNNSSGAIINEAGSNLIAGAITLSGGGGDTRIYTDAGTLTLAGDIAPNTTSRNLRLMGAGSGVITGVIRNGSATNVLISVTKAEAGAWMLSGANTHSGLTNLDGGSLIVGHPSALGNGGAQFGNTTGGTVITSPGATAGAFLNLNGQQGILEVITLRGTGTGAAGALVNHSVTSASIAAGALSSISTTGGGVHSAVPDVTIAGGGSGATATATLGVSIASFTITGGTTIYSAAPTVTISGGGGTGATATAALTSGVVSGITITNAGTGYSSAPTIAFSGGTISTASTNPTGTGNATNFIVSAITVTNPGTGYSSAPAVSFSSGTGTTASANLSAVVLAANTSIGGTGDTVLNPGVTGGFSLTKVGAGTLTLNGANTYTGATNINAGRLVISGTLTSNVTTNAAILAPNGTPSTSGNLTQASTATYQVFINNGTVGTGYDQLSVGGTVSLNGALDIIAGPNLAPGSTFTILNKTSAGAISGTFTGRASNTTFTTAGGYTFRINYNLGTGGNDVVLTLITTPLEQWRYANFGSIPSMGNGADLLDLDLDRLVNLLEYALGGDPNIAASAPLPQANILSGRLALTFLRTLANNDITMTVQGADSAAGPWTDLASSVQGAVMTPLVGGVAVTETGTGATRSVEVRDLYLTTDPARPRRFLRVWVTKP